MCTQTNDIPRNDIPRDINELLALPTYQGMTDAEIELVISYRANQMMIERITNAEWQRGIQTQNEVIEVHRVACERGHSVLESILERVRNRTTQKTITQTFDAKSVTPNVTEVRNG